MATILDDIVQNKKTELRASKEKLPLAELIEKTRNLPVPPDFLNPLKKNAQVALIAEVKKASPSKGIIRSDFQPLTIARQYSESGASCISVLTDAKFFQGRLEFLQTISQHVQTPLLRKDFIIDPYQVYEARLAGASAVLLIAECLDGALLQELHDLILELNMIPLLEFHDAGNLESCLESGARLIGINNRNLSTFETDLNHVINLRPQIPADRTLVAESGIHTREDVLRLQDANIDAMLVGESLMRQDDISQAVLNLLS